MAAAMSISASAIAWASATDKRIKTATDPGLLKNLSSQADRYCARSGLNPAAQAELHLCATAAYGRLAQLHIDEPTNGELGFRELQAAVRLDPNDPHVAASYGRALLIISKLNMFFRFFATKALGIDLTAEMNRDLTMLAANPQDPLCQMVRQEVAQRVGDSGSEAAANRQLTLLAATDPAGVAKARTQLASDANQAKNVKKS